MIVAIIQARMGSTRFPGKVLKKLYKKTILQIIFERVQKSEKIDKIIFATSNNTLDDKIENFCKYKNYFCFRGSEKNVLKRYYDCAKKFNAKTIIRLTADCPLVDPIIIDKVISMHYKTKSHYSSNTIPPEKSKWPNGSDVEVFSFKSLEQAYKNAKKLSEKEHVTFYIWKNNNNKFKKSQLPNNYNWSDYRYTLDYKEDYVVLKKIYKQLINKKIFGYTNEIIKIINNNPGIKKINNNYNFEDGWNR